MCPISPSPERPVADLAQDGVRILSLNPRHETLEDYFAPGERGGSGAARGERTRPGSGCVNRMSAVGTIVGQVVRDAARRRVLQGAILFALLAASAAPVVGRLAAGQDLKVVADFGLAATELAGLFIAVFMGVGGVAREMESRTLDAVLSKPIRRHEFILGQYAGLLAALAVGLAVMTVGLYAVLAAARWWGGPGPVPPPDPALLQAVFLIFVQLAVLAAAALCFSTWAAPGPAAAATGGLYVVGHFRAELQHFETVVDAPPAVVFAAGLARLLPDLAAFDVKAAVVHGQPVGAAYMALTAGAGTAYILAFLVVAVAVFARRDLA